MVNQKEKVQMRDFITGRLETSGVVRAESQDLVEGGRTNYIIVGKKGAVILLDRVYPNDSLVRVRKLFRSEGVDIATVFYKDGEDFFRSASRDNQFKGALNLSLKNYNGEQIQRMILLSPNEIRAAKNQEVVQYYQPKSERLDEAIISLRFEPVKFDYSHIDSNEKFRPEDKKSKRLYIWDDKTRTSMTGDLRLSGSLLLE